MKKLFLLYAILAGGVSNYLFAQNPSVGINTTSPQGPFHVDAKGNTNGTSNTSDDVIVTKEGNLGIGTLTPTAKVHVKTDGTTNGFRLSDQSERKASMLMFQDNTGTVNWVPKPFSLVETKLNENLDMDYPFKNYSNVDPVKKDKNVPRNSNDHREITFTGQGLKLTPGIWMIMAKYLVVNPGKDEGFLYWTYLHDLDDLDGLSEDSEHLKDKRSGCMNRDADPYDNCKDQNGFPGKYNRNWYLASDNLKGEVSKKAMCVVGIYPEAKFYQYTTPYVNYIAVIKSDGKNPGDPGYEHEIALTFSTSLPAFVPNSLTRNALHTDTSINHPTLNRPVDIGTYFFAVRLDIN
ncbi:hypothetical protein [uncultured Apibacter sp.]|uniref:hypothetical protein n=1 Tax=uncultured Apibacter sp. TaxID=1778616 RepID=UPI0025FB0EFD|nr:hypothetical protein [uncultured Apibacter sp.]